MMKVVRSYPATMLYLLVTVVVWAGIHFLGVAG
jgi:hypothetical protein